MDFQSTALPTELSRRAAVRRSEVWRTICKPDLTVHNNFEIVVMSQRIVKGDGGRDRSKRTIRLAGRLPSGLNASRRGIRDNIVAAAAAGETRQL